VPTVGPDVAVAEAAQVWRHDLEPGGCQWPRDPPPDALGLGPPMHQQQGHATDADVCHGQLDVAHPMPFDMVEIRIQVSAHSFRPEG